MTITRRLVTDLEKYNPEKGLKIIAITEAAEKHYARVKDLGKLETAIRAKLTAQAEFVLWWDHHVEKDKGGRPPDKKTRIRSDTGSHLGQNGLPSRLIVSRWRQHLNDPDKFETTYLAALARYTKILEFTGGDPHVSQNSGENEWYTPPDLIEAARRVLGAIDLDPATSLAANEVVKAGQIFTREENGLNEPWHGRVWMNPPYAQPTITQFCAKLALHLIDGDVSAAVVLVNNATETEWFQTLARVSIAVCFPRNRVQFWAPDKTTAAPLQGQAVLYAGPVRDRFCAEFQGFGEVWVRP
jgi:ParB family chromosome partitioning protein